MRVYPPRCRLAAMKKEAESPGKSENKKKIDSPKNAQKGGRKKLEAVKATDDDPGGSPSSLTFVASKDSLLKKPTEAGAEKKKIPA